MVGNAKDHTAVDQKNLEPSESKQKRLPRLSYLTIQKQINLFQNLKLIAWQ